VARKKIIAKYRQAAKVRRRIAGPELSEASERALSLARSALKTQFGAANFRNASSEAVPLSRDTDGYADRERKRGRGNGE